MRILVTGATGFAGGHLIETLLARDERTVVGLSRSSAWPDTWSHFASRVPLLSCDLCDGKNVETVLRDTRPEAIVHLAGYASPARSFAEPDAAWAGNLTATRSLYDAVVRWGGSPRILYVGSVQIYGERGRDSQRLDEDAPLRPSSPYAASKAAADLASYQYSRFPGLDIVRARPGNHFGPRQSADYAIPNFARQLTAIARGTRPAVVETGNLDSRRDLSDVRDVIDAYLALLQHGQRGEAYNIATGQSRTIGEVLQRLVALSGLKVEVRQRADLVRPVDPPTSQVDTSKLRHATGWTPRRNLDQTLTDLITYWNAQPPEGTKP